MGCDIVGLLLLPSKEICQLGSNQGQGFLEENSDVELKFREYFGNYAIFYIQWHNNRMEYINSIILEWKIGHRGNCFNHIGVGHIAGIHACQENLKSAPALVKYPKY